MMKRITTVSVLVTALIFLLSVSIAFGAQDFKVKKTSFGPRTVEYAEGEIIVKFKANAKAANVKALQDKSGATELYTSLLGGFKRVKIPASKSVEEMVELYRADPDVEYAEPNYIFHALMTPNDPYYSYQWHMPMINMEQAWDLSTGSGVVVAIVDCGVAYEDYGSFGLAPDLAGTNFVQGYDYVNNDSHPNDDNGHGTHVCGTVAQTTNNSLGVTGVAFNCSIMPVKVLDASGNGYLSDVADGIYYAADNGAHVINMSLGSTSSSSTLQNACQYAYNKGVTIVCAAGNAGTSTPQYPASYSVCISVSAVRFDSTLSYYSSYGSNIDLCAPGGDVYVDQNGDGYVDGVLQQTHDGTNYTNFGYYFYQGTSMASPHVAGVAALILSKAGGGGSLTPDQVKSYLVDNVVDLGSSGWDQYFGHGLADANAAVSAVGGNPPVANFSGSPTSGCVPLTVNFTDLSSGSPTSWSWNFGDGGTSTQQNPSHTYTTTGTYTVSLTATNAYGSDTETKTAYITVNDLPMAGFTGSPTSGEVPLTVNFTNQSSGATSYLWDFGDTQTSTATNPSHTYTAAGTFTVTLTATNSCGSDDEIKIDYITVTCTPPVADFSGSPTSGEVPLTVNFTDLSTGATSWDWDFGDTKTSTAQNPSHTYTSTGTYTVALTATNSCGNDTETKIDYITVTCTPPVAAFSGSPTSGTAPLTVDFTDASTSATSWSWDFGDFGTSTAQNPSHIYTDTGTYTVTLTVTNSCGSDVETKVDYITVTGGGGWTVITYDDFEGGWGNYTDGGGDCSRYTGGTYAHQGSCAADIQDNSGVASSFYHTVGYDVSGFTELEVEFWYMPVSMDNSNEDFWLQYYDGSNWQTVETWARSIDFENNNFYHEVVTISSGTYNFPTNAKLRFMCDASGNSDDVYIDEIEFRGMSAGPTPPTAEFSGTPTSGTAPLEVTFTDESTGNPTSWDWTFGDGGTSTAQNPSYIYDDPGTYTVSLTVTNAYGNDTETKTGYITVNPPGAWTVITYDDFESGWGSYTDGGGDCSRYTRGTYAHQGSAAADIQDNSGISSSFYHTVGHNVAGYTELEVEFWFRAQSMESGEDFWVQYYNGSSWQTVATFVSGTDFNNGTFYNEVVTISSSQYNFPTNAQLRFRCDASDNRDDVYIDEIEFRGMSGTSGTSAKASDNSLIPDQFSLSQNYPNPFNPTTEIQFSLPQPSHVSLLIYNVLGQRVAVLADGSFSAGRYTVTWDASRHSSGVYFYRLQTEGFVETKKMLLVK